MPQQFKAYNKSRESRIVKPRQTNYVRNAVSVADMAYKAATTAAVLKKLINVEFKHVDFSRNAQVVDFNGLMDYLNDSGQGTTDQSHIGDSILNKHTSIRGKLQRGTVDSVVRLIVIKDKSDAMTIPTLLTNTGTSVTPFSTREKDHRSNYTIMKDMTYTLDSGRPSLSFNFELKSNDHTKFNAATNTINTNAFRFVFISDQPAGVGAAAPTITYARRHSYIDN